ncbi:SDR family NAD(P)-dependent oxidoreductase [Rhizobium ruizarguesonis]|uniref:SDR family NAD(P)-dependent oxidoreductase n=1 Tax=Rhizobium ruizarguesonis TaxID=2081791 RepID=A0ABY1X5G7_9HYPH|nr:SDR family NAD(P)-dependent oxidoreductase [Rhizobium ruizarguesonis]TAU17159.1 SDR family NAD(P)-dependent oxidoreductase [Rhizobium ruizarguesonis]TAU57547.1 SDR family NAD(P)-dependent oxidoreductase [Rhizobium ruizarguesonis]TAU59367.1 SDR family NAD(P)-dependent oxidoreductase [Rhizobium ruizarguesonis]TAV03558.1 SDR family NAD(P)-dependent oxidoreductase [Rhizobium ruizarguesonis]TAV19700.1 SDR family NAD(P)-dependent oxidoreductase [Rhizobium ruizarguesonis]
MQMTGNTILITGGTSGIGRGLAEAFHRLGNQVLIAGRRQGRLDEIMAANPGMIGFQLDVQDPAAIDAFAARVREKVPELNVLVNNAGISRPESLTARSHLAISREIIETNIMGVLHMTAVLLPALKAKSNAAIITTTSGLAFVPRNNSPTYCASKAFLHSWLQSLRVQLRGSSVDVLELAPPYVQTELSGPHQLTDPHAMPLVAYISEVMQLLADPSSPDGEILVERVRGERFAERDGDYARRFAIFNGF